MAIVLPATEGVQLPVFFPPLESIRSISSPWDPVWRIPIMELQTGREMESGPSAQMGFVHGSPGTTWICVLTLQTNFTVIARALLQDLAYWNHTKNLSQPMPDIHTLGTCNFDSFDRTSGPTKRQSFIFLRPKLNFLCVVPSVWAESTAHHPYFKASLYIFLYHMGSDINSP